MLLLLRCRDVDVDVDDDDADVRVLQKMVNFLKSTALSVAQKEEVRGRVRQYVDLAAEYCVPDVKVRKNTQYVQIRSLSTRLSRGLERTALCPSRRTHKRAAGTPRPSHNTPRPLSHNRRAHTPT